jgi:hypothetical protein
LAVKKVAKEQIIHVVEEIVVTIAVMVETVVVQVVKEALEENNSILIRN